jgi:hypothetical protein
MGAITQLVEKIREAGTMDPTTWALHNVQALLLTAAEALERFQREEDERNAAPPRDQ